MSPPADTVGAGRSARLYFGDCLESMRAMPAESVDAVVCDPPYLLSDTSKNNLNCLTRIVTEVLFPKHKGDDVQSSQQGDFCLPTGSGANLRGFQYPPGIHAGICVPESTVDFQNTPVSEQEVNTGSVATGQRVAESNLSAEIKSSQPKNLAYFILQPANGGDTSFCDGACRCFTEPCFGHITMFVRTVRPACLPRPFACGGVDACDTNVGDDYDAPRATGTPTGVVAGSGAIDTFVLRLDLRGGTGEITPTEGAYAGHPAFELRPYQSTPASIGTGDTLPVTFKPYNVNKINCGTHGTFTLYLPAHVTDLLSGVTRGGFMGKAWDGQETPQASYRFHLAWTREALRVLKPGGYLLAFGGTRTYHRLACAVEDAGFEIRDSLIYNYGSGFPKSLNVSIAIDKQAGAMGHRGKAIIIAGDGGQQANLVNPQGAPAHDPITDAAKRWKGWGSALKPAFEPVAVARKPLAKGLTVAGNVLKHGTGALNIDGCRVGTTESTVRPNGPISFHGGGSGGIGGSDTGRWPANVLFTHAPGCLRAGSQKVKCSNAKYSGEGQGMGGAHGIYSALGARPAGVELGYADAEGKETVAAYECAPGCPVAALDSQTANLQPSKGGYVRKHGADQFLGIGLGDGRTDTPTGMIDAGGASRFFTVTEYGDDDRLPGAEPGAPPFYYASKASRSEREAGCGDLPARSGAEAVDRDEGSAGAQSPRAGAGRTASEVRNHHPCVKPLSIIRWLCRLVTPPGGIVLDPFMGSGTTGVAALLEGFNFVGCEREADYLLIAEARIAHHAPGARLLGPGDE